MSIYNYKLWKKNYNKFSKKKMKYLLYVPRTPHCFIQKNKKFIIFNIAILVYQIDFNLVFRMRKTAVFSIITGRTIIWIKFAKFSLISIFVVEIFYNIMWIFTFFLALLLVLNSWTIIKSIIELFLGSSPICFIMPVEAPNFIVVWV